MSAEFLNFQSAATAPASDTDGARDGLLTPRQYQVLAYLAKGFTNSEIGDILECSEGTVKNHVAAILSRLEVSNRTEAASEWMRQNGRQQATFESGGEPLTVRVEIATRDCTDLAMLIRAGLVAAGCHVVPAASQQAVAVEISLSCLGDTIAARIDMPGAGVTATVETDPEMSAAMRQSVRSVVAVVGSGLA